MGKKRGHPVTVYTPERVAELLEKLDAYIDSSDIPIVAEFCYLNRVPKQRLYELEELADSLKMLICKKEANLEKGLLGNVLNPTGAVFSLKQLGWSDRQEIDINQNVQFKFDIAYVDAEATESN